MKYRLWTRLRPIFTAISCVAFLCASAVFGSHLWIEQQVRSHRFIGIDETPTREVAIVPGVGRIRPNHPPRVLVSRLRTALALYRAHKVQAILASGVGGDGSATDEIVAMQQWLRLRGVPAQHILVDPSGLRTFDTMWRAADILHVRGAVVCTQAPHMNRSLFLARSMGIDAVGLVAPLTGYAIDPWRQDAVKEVLAVADIYFLGTRPRIGDTRGVIDPRNVIALSSN